MTNLKERIVTETFTNHHNALYNKEKVEEDELR